MKVHHLPIGPAADPRLALPLSRGAAELLWEMLVSQPEEPRDGWALPLSQDPSLVLWLVLEVLGASASGPVRTVGELAARLSVPEIAECLAPLGEPLDDPSPGAESAGAPRPLQLADFTPPLGEDGTPPAERSLSSILMRTIMGFESDVRALLPAWLLARARGAGCQWDVAAASSAIEAPRIDDPHRQEAGLWGDRLPKLARRLLRLHALETAFAGQLEREKLAALKELAYGASHEINNPLANISSRAQTLLRDEPDPDRRRVLAAMNRQAFRAHEMIADMMLFAHPPRLEASHFDMYALAGEIAAEFAADAAEGGITLTTRCAGGSAWVWADRVQMSVLLRALLQNAVNALEHPGTIHVQTEQRDQQLLLSVTDDGPGIDARVRQHLFDPFFSGREAGRGLGFGLSKAYRLAELHGGRLDVITSDATTTFACAIPVDVRPRGSRGGEALEPAVADEGAGDMGEPPLGPRDY